MSPEHLGVKEGRSVQNQHDEDMLQRHGNQLKVLPVTEAIIIRVKNNILDYNSNIKYHKSRLI